MDIPKVILKRSNSMDEILNKLLESELLNDDTKTQITEAFNAAVDGMRQQVREELEIEVRGELVEQWTTQRDALIEAVDAAVVDMVANEMIELKDDINSFRDLEAEFAEKIVTEKHRLANQLAEELDKLVDDVSSFLDERIDEEMIELKEDLEEVRKNEFGRKIFETFSSEFNTSFVDDETVQAQLRMTESKLADAEKRLGEIDLAQAKAVRESKMTQLLSNLTGTKREQMAMVLEHVETSRLDEAYNTFIGRIVKEDSKPAAKKVEAITETKETKKENIVVTGDDKVQKTVVNESTDGKKPVDLNRWLKIAGINQ